MSAPLIDPAAAPHAHHTSWAYDANDNYILVLENAVGEPIAFASYKFAAWARVLASLVEIEEQRARPQ